MLKYGIEHLVEQVVNYKINSLFWPKIEDVVKEFLGITETPTVANKHNDQSNDKKAIDKTQVKSEDMVDYKVKIEESVDCQPMDIETDSNCSTDQRLTVQSDDRELSVTNPDADCPDWPTPPQPEMITPERQQSKESPKCQIDSNDNSTNVSVKSETIFGETNIRVNETFMINKSLMDELKNQKNCDSNEHKSNKVEVKDKTEVKTEELSDVSSVHTSDLSDFDDEISLDDSNDEKEDKKKKKISLKVAKKITEVLSNQKSCDARPESSIEKQNTFESQNSDDSKGKSETKRIRKVNPKYSSKEFSSIFSRRHRNEIITSNAELKESAEEQNKSESEHKTTRKRRQSNCSDENKEMNESDARGSKTSRKQDECQLDSRSSSRGSIESLHSETTQDSTQSQRRSHKRNTKNRFDFTFELHFYNCFFIRNESQTQRYESSDLYKPRPMISSRRQRAPTTPDSSNQSNEEFFVHDLSK